MQDAIRSLNASMWVLCVLNVILLGGTGIGLASQGIAYLVRADPPTVAAGIISASLAVAGALFLTAVPWWVAFCVRLIRD